MKLFAGLDQQAARLRVRQRIAQRLRASGRVAVVVVRQLLQHFALHARGQAFGGQMQPFIKGEKSRIEVPESTGRYGRIRLHPGLF